MEKYIILILILIGVGYVVFRSLSDKSRIRKPDDVSGRIRDEIGKLKSENNGSTKSIGLLKDSNKQSGKLVDDLKRNNTESQSIIARARELLQRAKKRSIDKKS